MTKKRISPEAEQRARRATSAAGQQKSIEKAASNRTWQGWTSAIGFGLLAGVAAGTLTPMQPSAADAQAAANVVPASAVQVTPPQDELAPFELLVEPTATSTAASGRQQLRAQAKINNRFGKRASFKLSQILVSSKGQLVAGPTQLNAVALGAGGRAAQTFVSPEALGDGNYKWRVVAAGSDNTIDSVQEGESYFSVKAGVVTPLDATEWYALPEVNQANEG
jgi:hypothetical protein